MGRGQVGLRFVSMHLWHSNVICKCLRRPYPSSFPSCAGGSIFRRCRRRNRQTSQKEAQSLRFFVLDIKVWCQRTDSRVCTVHRPSARLVQKANMSDTGFRRITDTFWSYEMLPSQVRPPMCIGACHIARSRNVTYRFRKLMICCRYSKHKFDMILKIKLHI